ncbi:MAG TPA: hypothetical protein VHQ90_18110 [Thermoanaerobaculia bacterium]|nr:hypothetical protein [Thermoanaerobaculia bacterium]
MSLGKFTIAAALLIPGHAHTSGARAGTSINGLVFADFSDKQNQDKATGAKSSDSGVGADVKRFYFTVTHEFDSVWSAQFQSDIGDQGARRYDVLARAVEQQDGVVGAGLAGLEADGGGVSAAGPDPDRAGAGPRRWVASP